MLDRLRCWLSWPRWVIIPTGPSDEPGAIRGPVETCAYCGARRGSDQHP